MFTKPKVYLAGPIELNRERWGLFNWNLNEAYDDSEGYDKITIDELPPNLPEDKDMIYTGPFVGGSCDHGCAHHLPHASAIGSCMGSREINKTDEEFKRAAVVRDMKGIHVASHVIGWIDREECHGTIAELSYALALMKPVYLGFKNQALIDSHWFLNGMVQASKHYPIGEFKTGVFDDPIEVLERAGIIPKLALSV